MSEGWKRRHLLGITTGYLSQRPHPGRTTIHVDIRRQGWRYLRFRFERFEMGHGPSFTAHISFGRAS